ncbi:MAG TPA: patatin-like phospholipase family protein [Gammaproteobacteria bacterium]
MSNEQQKLGLALSGGGFRASFFHVGVLARLAELGLLRRVEVISAVSGGAIIAALYYLHVKRLLEERPDENVTDEDYVAIVQRIEREFLTAVQKNLRMRAFRNPLKNLRMTGAKYSRSDRLGELYDELLYRPVLAPGSKAPIEMRNLHIRPKDGPEGFHPRRHNAARKAKVPILILNATSLNTGHNWRFEASRMGEPPLEDPMVREADKNMRLRRPPTYADIARHQQNIELGLAVAASACVPGIFAPLAISGLYDRGVRVQLVDGGVHDNQGIKALLDERCTHFVVSDASGQIPDEIDPATGDLSVLLRSNDILMDRVREEELFALLGAHGATTAFVHLRKGLEAEGIAWLGPEGKPAAAMAVERVSQTPCLAFGVHPEVQARLSRVRTDLDSFTEVEAQSLMLDAYLMSVAELRSVLGASAPSRSVQWGFLAIAPWMTTPTEQYLRHLEVARRRVCKVFRLSWTVTAATALVAGLLAAGLWRWQGEALAKLWEREITVGNLLLTAGGLALGLLLPAASRAFSVLRFVRAPAEWLFRLMVRGLLPAVGSLLVWIDLLIFDPLFLRLGRTARLERPGSPDVAVLEPAPDGARAGADSG